ncbi:MAG: hypothetical protein KY455_06945 [Euryarchaeota archaeon]|nr:hypothetical protein [Euryarchaeota archaeon]
MAAARHIFLVFCLTLLLGSLVVSAHEPPRPRGFETRLVTDQNDDCGGHGETGCNGSHDLLALSLREAWLPEAEEHALVFAPWMTPGQPGTTLEERIIMDGPDGEIVIIVTTDDGETFTAEPSLRLEGPYPLFLGDERDGDRFGLDITVARNTLGLETGDTLSGFRVEAFVGDEPGDVMPGTYVLPDGGMAEKGKSEKARSAETVRPDYTLQGPTGYARLAPAETAVKVTVGTTTTVGVTVENRLRDMEQEIGIVVEAPSGVTATINGNTSYTATFAPQEERSGLLDMTGDTTGAGGTLTLRLTTGLGGLEEATVDVTVEPATRDDASEADGQEAPTVTVLIVVATLLSGTSMARRRPR